MKVLLLLPLLLILISTAHAQNTTNDGSSLTVLSSKWFKSRQTIEKLDSANPSPAGAVLPLNKNFELNARNNAPAGMRDPNADTVDGRRAALEKSVQDARAPKPKPVDGFAYRAKVENSSAKVVEVIFWEYQFTEASNPSMVTRRQFLCGVNIKPNKDKELQAFGLSGPSDVISAEGLANKAGKLFEEKVVINRVEYADGSIWQRKDWNFAEVKSGIARALATPWGTEMCRGL